MPFIQTRESRTYVKSTANIWVCGECVLLNASLLLLQSVTMTVRCPSCWWSVRHVTCCSVMLNSKEGRRGQMDSIFSAKHSGANRRERALLFMKNMWNQSNPNYPPAVHVACRASRPSRGTATQIERASLTHSLLLHTGLNTHILYSTYT